MTETHSHDSLAVLMDAEGVKLDNIPEYTAEEERANIESTSLSNFKLIKSYLDVYTHGGFLKDGTCILYFWECHLPQSGVDGYSQIMDELFRFIIEFIEKQVMESMIIVYCQYPPTSRHLPPLYWVQKAHTRLDRIIKKKVKALYIIYPKIVTRFFLSLSKLFVSSKFFRKVKLLNSFEELSTIIGETQIIVPKKMIH